ncbi:hypothetical protein LOK74_07400 [Brevibacillus humidisoli]|uniref:hypothetical protein n=1 Tax=Brevibacillus humidisoli TaxID=2895522 RepID=UPI001E2E7F5B|nr:hypothetical protein [Brevibacillus humidisoli]UFJ42306.1 hypothetical protein LOK74_07400 [Brevibacillus humidisoli]
MQVVAYRGVEYQEALAVIDRQRYTREERRSFPSGVQAKAVFGSGVYLVSDPQVAAEYAFCHAEAAWDKAAVLKQWIHLNHPMYLHEQYDENELRKEALYWKYTCQEMETVRAIMEPDDWLKWTGEQIREYLLERGFDGIAYRVHDSFTYYVCYHQDQQIYDISLLALFDVPCSR